MTFLDLLAFKKMTIYRLSQLSGIPKTTLTDLGSGKTSLLDASGKTLLGISKVLKVRIEELLELEPEEDMKKITALFSGGHHQISKIDPERQLAYGLLRDGTQ